MAAPPPDHIEILPEAKLAACPRDKLLPFATPLPDSGTCNERALLSSFQLIASVALALPGDAQDEFESR
jgi:hypothetical protein